MQKFPSGIKMMLMMQMHLITNMGCYRNLAKNKEELYNPDALAPAASAGRPELGQ
jgi:hypothetical protein